MNAVATAAVADERAREHATDPQRSILLQAPAGSGKTTVLTQRLLRLLAEVDEPEEILAITFTRKAAAEMRARVLKALRGETESTSAQGQRVNALARAALEKGASRGWNLAQDPGRLRIQTIDSFNFRLASQLPVTAKAGGALAITDRPLELYHRAARATLAAAEGDAELGADVEFLFERLDNHWSNVERLLASMLAQRGHWLRYVLGHEPQALCDRISESLANIVREHLTAACGHLPGALRAEAGALHGSGVLEHEPGCLAAWKRLALLTLTKQGEWRKPKGINKTLGPGYETAAAKDALRACLESFNGVAGAREVLVELNSLPAATLYESDAAAIMALSRVLRAAAIQLQAEFAIAGRVDHTYIAGAARAALADAGLPTDLALRTGLSLRHILVDEFQDTSLAQFDLVEALTTGWEEGDGRTLFVVGDPMQSIYQFREAEVGLFLRARDSGIGSVRLDALQLARNFRSTPELIEWTNDSFASLFPAADDLRASAVAFTSSLPGRSRAPRALEDGGVSTRLFPDDRASETAAITARIAELKAHDSTATIAVLVASRSHAAPIMTALEAQQVDAIGVDLIPLRDLSVVRDLVALLQALHHLGDRTAWLAVLRAPWCGLSLESLTALSHRGDGKLLWEALADAERLARCPPDEVQRLTRVREVLGEALQTQDSLPLSDWLEGTWLRLGAADAYPRQDLRHARAFLTALSDRAAAGEWNGPQDLDSLLGDLYAQPQASTANPVQLMTIHRAKGLEFDHVFVPSLDRELNRGREPLLRWLDLPRSHGESDLVMAPVPAIGDDAGGDVGAYLKRLIAKRAANEQTRLLYVAATRAKQTLYLSAAPKSKPDGSVGPRTGTLLACLWPALGEGFAEGTRAPGTAQSVARTGTSGVSGAWDDGQTLARPGAVSGAIALTVAAAGVQTFAGGAAEGVGGGADITGASASGASASGAADATGASASGAADITGASASGAADTTGASASGAADATGASASGAADTTGASADGAPEGNSEATDTPIAPLRRLPADWTPPAFEAAADLPRLPIGRQSLEPPEFSWVGETGRHIGTVVHAGLEAFAEAAELPVRSRIEGDRDTYLHQLRRHGVPDRDLPRAAALVVEALTRTVEDERGRWIFAPDHKEASSELALTGMAAGRLTGVIIDRSFVDRDGTRWVIDFKTSRHEGSGLKAFLAEELKRYRPQLETYVALARGLGSNPVRAGLYFPLLGEFCELP